MKKFICDHMCLELGKWLRIAGYDVAVKIPIDDRELFQMAQEEGRILLTRDRHFKEIDKEGRIVYFLQGEGLEEWARQLKHDLAINWLYHPFSRCITCNTILKQAEPTEDIPDFVKENQKTFWICPQCHQTFWLGSHTDHMQERLTEWHKN